jgi:hypothetical protein
MPKSKSKYITFIPKANGFRALSGDNTRRVEKLQSASPEELQAFYELTENVKLKIKGNSINVLNSNSDNVKQGATFQCAKVCLGLLEKSLTHSNKQKIDSLRKIKALAEENNKTATEMYEEMIYCVAIDIVSKGFENENNNLRTL